MLQKPGKVISGAEYPPGSYGASGQADGHGIVQRAVSLGCQPGGNIDIRKGIDIGSGNHSRNCQIAGAPGNNYNNSNKKD